MTTAIDCTAKLCAFRKTRDGVVASFVIHPNEVPDKLQTDPIGTSYVMALVEVDDATGQPKEVMPADTKSPDTSPRPLPKATHRDWRTGTDVEAKAGGAKKGWDELSPAQQAGIWCADPLFQAFLCSTYTAELWRENREDRAADLVRELCGVKSRADIAPGTSAWLKWRDLASHYRTWQREPEVIG